MSRQQAVEKLQALGVPLAPAHGSVEELKREILVSSSTSRFTTKRLYNPLNQCARKLRFAQPKDAERMARRITKNSGGDPVHAYACGYCRGWHCGKEPRK